jgi:type VI protein secretion system component VasK
MLLALAGLLTGLAYGKASASPVRRESVQRLLERLGFRCEARLVEADWFKGEWSTLRIYAMLAGEWSGHQTSER